MPREIGFAIQPGHYLHPRPAVQQPPGLFYRLTGPLQRGIASLQGGANQGLGAMSSAWAGHTLLHSRNTQGPVTERLSTGFSPDGLLQSARVGLGPVSPLLAGAVTAAGGAIGGSLGGRAGAAVGAVLGAVVSNLGARDVHGRFHDETGIEHDPRSIGSTLQVSQGVHERFTEMQRELLVRTRETYSFRPDLNNSQNCGSAAVREMIRFLAPTLAQATVMSQLQALAPLAAAGGAPAQLLPSQVRLAMAMHPHARQPSPTQVNVHTLAVRTVALRATIAAAQVNDTGNQGQLTAQLRTQGALHNMV